MPDRQQTIFAVTLTDDQVQLLTHAVGRAKLSGDHVPAIARAVLINAQLGVPLDAYGVTHALLWAEDYQARTHPPM